MNERQISKNMQGKEKIFWLYFNSNQCKISYDRENNYHEENFETVEDRWCTEEN